MVKIRQLVIQIAMLVAFIALWQIATGAGILKPIFYGEPMKIFSVIIRFVISGSIWPHLLTTFTEVVAGFTLGVVSGILAGLLVGNIRFLGDVFEPYMMVLNAIPKTALAPLMIVWFGIDITSKIALVAIFVFFVVFFNTFGGVRNVDVDLINVAKILGASFRQVLMKVIVPSSFPFIFVGIKLALALSFVGAIVGEFLSANRGIGYLLAASANAYDMNEFFAALTILLMVVVVLDFGLRRFEKHLLRWRHEAA